MNKNFDEPAWGLKQAGAGWWASRKFWIVLSGLTLACSGGVSAWAQWTPPESSVTPPAVLTLDAFAKPALNGKFPVAPMIVGPDGALYGSTSQGGTNGYGTLFRLETDGRFTPLHDFYTDGGSPTCPLVVGPDAAMYGLTRMGGAYGDGTLFRVETNGTFTKLHDFIRTEPTFFSFPLVVGPDGALYGLTVSGGAGGGTLFRIQTNGIFTELHDFNGDDGWEPLAGLVVGPDGALYGSTHLGGADGDGTLFRMQTTGVFTKLHDFAGDDGVSPEAPLVVGPDGALYGSARAGGISTNGTLFRLQTDGTFTKVHDFDGSDGAFPDTPLVVGPDGALYGIVQFGGVGGVASGHGTLFRLEINGTFTKLHDLNGPVANLLAPLVAGPDGALYGSTSYGGNGDSGALFQLQTNGVYTKLYDFYGTNGADPSVAMVIGSDGALYGSTLGGGDGGNGLLFKLVLNRPPVARCHNVTVSAGINCAADASVDNGSSDPDAADTITLRQEPPGPYPLGTTMVTLIVTDNHGASASCTASVTVVDATPPAISGLAATPDVLWPPNHKLVEVSVSYVATDNCGAVSNSLIVTSNEVPNGPANRTAPDWVIEDSHHVLLRADRSVTGTGRVYEITLTSTDTSGNASARTINVIVPRNPK